MLTLAETPAELDAPALRFAALLAISLGSTPDSVRARSAGTDREVADKQLADEIEYLAERGVTERAAGRVFRERDRKNPAYKDYRYSEQDAREAAMLYLAVGITSASLRGRTALRGTAEERRMSAMIADQMDVLTANSRSPEGTRMSSKFSTSQAGESINVHDGNGDLAGWAYLSDGHDEPAGTPMAAKFVGDECKYTQHESIDAAITHIES